MAIRVPPPVVIRKNACPNQRRLTESDAAKPTFAVTASRSMQNTTTTRDIMRAS